MKVWKRKQPFPPPMQNSDLEFIFAITFFQVLCLSSSLTQFNPFLCSSIAFRLEKYSRGTFGELLTTLQTIPLYGTVPQGKLHSKTGQNMIQKPTHFCDWYPFVICWRAKHYFLVFRSASANRAKAQKTRHPPACSRVDIALTFFFLSFAQLYPPLTSFSSKCPTRKLLVTSSFADLGKTIPI